MYKKNGRLTYRSNRKQGYKKNNNFSNGRIRPKGNVTQQYQKYLKLAKEASSSGDRIQTEYYYQFTDHYSRLMLELGIPFNDEEESKEVYKIKSIDQKEGKAESEEKQKVENENNENIKNTKIASSHDEEEQRSIESVSFIAEPTRKKTSK